MLAGDSRKSVPNRLRAFWTVTRPFAETVEVVDAHFALYAFFPTIFGPLRGRPLVVHFHGPWADEAASAGRGNPVSVWVKYRLERMVYVRATYIVTLSLAFKQRLVERYRVAPWKVRVIPPGVNLEHFRPGDRASARKALGIADDEFVALTVRRLVPRMGHDVLLRAWNEVVRETPGCEVTLLIAGEGPSRSKLEELAENLNLGKSVRFLGRISEDELLQCYQAANVSVVPSTQLEGFGLIVLEALACGTPVIASDVGGLPEALAGLDDDLIVPSKQVVPLASRIAAAIRGTVPLPSSNACRRHAERFSWELSARENLRVCEDAIVPPSRDRLKVVYLTHFAGLSGGELALSRLFPTLAAQVDAHAILAEPGPLETALTDRGISVEVMRMPAAARSLRRDKVRPRALPAASVMAAATYAAKLALRIRAIRPDVVHTNSLKAAIYGGIAARLAGVPVVWHVRDRIDTDYLPRPAVTLIRALARALPTIVIANSAATRATLGSACRKAVVVHSPIEVGANPAVGHDKEAHYIRVGMVGRIAPWKGQDAFLRAFARAFPNGDEKATIVGAPLFGEEDYLDYLKRLANDLDLEARIEWRGFRRDIGAELARFDILVHSSTIAEPFGQVVVEGMAAGLPVIAPNIGGPAEVIEHGRTGWLYTPQDEASLVAGLRRLADDPQLRAQLGRQGKQDASRYSPEMIAPQILNVYKTVVGARHAGASHAVIGV